jgi:hypothetical protein
MNQELKFLRKKKRLIERLRSLQMDFNDLFILECFQYPEDKELLDIFNIPSLQDFNISARFQFLEKNEYLVKDPNDISKTIISVKGKSLIEDLLLPDSIITPEGNTISVEMIDFGKTDEEKFEEWWKNYPTTVAWKSDDGNSIFVGSRNLKNLTKVKAKERYLKLLNQGLSHEELLGSLRYEIKMKKLDSIKKGANQMESFKGMESYFNSERYLQHIEDYKADPSFVKGEEAKVKSRRKNVTDI